ncbi:MAG: SURF1 family protein [Caldilineaceae bacterium]|nr:SURF1 family protein [Caldilineaceae bacterium]
MASALETVRLLVSRRWWWVTILVILGVIAQVWLGVWQLDRLDQRRAFNANIAAKWREEPFDLNRNPLPPDLTELEFQRIQVTGEYDFTHEIVLQNQSLGDGVGSMMGGAPGVYLVTPLIYAPNQAVLVVRGWVPLDEAEPGMVETHQESAAGGIVGYIQESQTMPGGGEITVPAGGQRAWNFLNIDAIQPQMPYALSPFFILQLPEEGRSFSQLPIRVEPIVLTEGNHFSYAIQWFMFATILGIGYIFFVRYSEQRARRIAQAGQEAKVG